MALSNDLKIRLDAEFNGEAKFKSAEASAKALARELDRVENGLRAMAAQEAAAYREGERLAAAHAAAVKAGADAQAKAMGQVGTVMAAASAATVVGLGLATKAAMDWEGAWAGVTKTVSGSGPQLDALEGSLRQMAMTLPASHEEIAAVAEAAGQLGVKTPAIASFTKTMIDLGETTNLTSDEAATSLAQLMNVMGTAPDDVGRLGAALVALGNDGASTEKDILQLAGYITGAGKLIGASETDVLALANAMSSMGINAERGGGVMTRILQDIYSSVASGGDQLEGYAEVAGMSADAFAQAWQADPIAALDSFIQGLNRVEQGGGNVVQTLSDLGIKGTQDTAVLLQMKGAGDLLADSLALGNAAWAENNALTDEANKRYETTEARVQMARNQINDAAIDIGANFLPVVADGADVVANLSAAFGSLSDGQKEWVTYLGLGAAGVTGLVGAAAIVIPKLTELRAVLDDLGGGSSRLGKGLGAVTGVLAGPWGLALAGGAVLLGAWVNQQGEAKKKVDALAAAVDAQTGAITENARSVKIDQLVDDGVYAQAERLGISLELVTDAALGNKTALADVNEQLNAVFNADGSTDAATGQLSIQAQAAADLQTALQGSSEATSEAQDQARQKAAAMGEDADATNAAADAAATGADAVTAMADAMAGGAGQAEDTTDAIDALSKALDALNGGQLSANDAARGWEAALDGARASLEEHGRTLDITTDAGRANQESLDGMAEAAMANAEAILRNTGDHDAFRATLEGARGDLFDTAKAFGLSDEAASAYVESVLAIPPQAVTKAAFDDEIATTKVDAFRAKLAALHGSSVRATIVVDEKLGTTVQRGDFAGRVIEKADGGRIPLGLGGPRQDNVPAWLSSGEFVVNAAATARHLPLLEAINAQRLADGGLAGYAAGGPVPQAVSHSLLTGLLSAGPAAPVTDARYGTALRDQGAAASAAADAETRLREVREGNKDALEDLKESLADAADAERERLDAVLDAAAAELDALKERQRAEKEALSERQRAEKEVLAERQRAEKDALAERHRGKDRDGGADRAAMNALESRQRAAMNDLEATQRAASTDAENRQRADVAAAEARITAVKKDNEAATKALKKANEERIDQAEDEHARQAAAAEDALSAAKTRAAAATDELKDAEAELAKARADALALAEKVSGAVTGGFDLEALVAGGSAASIQAAAGKAVARAKELSDSVVALMSQGLDGSLVDQITARGVGGLDIARRLLASGPGTVTGLNSALSDLTGVGQGLGSYVAATRYAPGGAGAAPGYGTGAGAVSIDAQSISALAGQVGAALDGRPLVLTMDGRDVHATVSVHADARAYRRVTV